MPLHEAGGATFPLCSSAAYSSQEVSDILTDQSPLQNCQKSESDNTLAHMCSLLTTHIQHQNQQALQQREMMKQMLSALSINTAATHTETKQYIQTNKYILLQCKNRIST